MGAPGPAGDGHQLTAMCARVLEVLSARQREKCFDMVEGKKLLLHKPKWEKQNLHIYTRKKRVFRQKEYSEQCNSKGGRRDQESQ